MDDFENPETDPWLLETIDDDEFQRFMESINDTLNEDNPQLVPPLNDEVVVEDSQFEEQNESGDLSLVPSVPLDCSGCILLRQMVHTNGPENVKLSIHGGLGVFYHAMIEVTYNADELSQAMEPSVIDLSDLPYEQIKQFLIDYGAVRAHNGYVLIQDSLSTFFDALCARVNAELVSTGNSGSPLHNQGLCQPNQTEAVTDPIRTEKTGIVAQRERTANLHIRDFADYFHLRIIDAAKEIGICPTVLKKICRKYGMRRWPYRKIKCIDTKIKKLQDESLAQGGHGAVSTRAEIERLRAQRKHITHVLR